MFSVLKLIGSAIWNWSAREVSPSDPPATVTQEKIQTEEQNWSFEGIVTKVNNLEQYGLVDSSVYFSFDAVSENVELSVGDHVYVQAVRKHVSHAWIARSVSRSVENWEIPEKASTNSNNNNLPVKANSLPNGVAGRTKTLQGTITSVHDTYAVVNNSIPFDLKDGRERFQPMKGDCVTILMGNTEDKVQSWWPTETRNVKGLVTSYGITSGVINHEVIFYHSLCQCDVTLSQGTEVSAYVIRSKQGTFEWRSTMITKDNQIELSSYRKRKKCFVDEKEGIVITQSLNFGEVFLCQKIFICAKLENMQSDPLILLSYYFINTEPSSEFFFGDINIGSKDKEHDSLFDSSYQTKGIVIPPGSAVTLNIHCKAQTPGRHEDSLVFEFDSFCICRPVKCTVVDPVHSLLKPTAPYVCKSKDQAKKMRNESLFFIPGEKPYYPKGRFSKNFPVYSVPRSLWNAIENRSSVTQAAPCLLEDLSIKNYVAKFRCLLHLEEIQAILDMREFNIPNVCLYKRGEFLSLEVPGLAEGRPSLLIGDRVMLFHPDRSVEIAYEGYIHEVLKSEVLLKFNDSFHAKYDTETFDVAFQFNRSSFRRCHHAVACVFNKNAAVLFPSLTQVKPCLVKDLPVTNSEEILDSEPCVKKDLSWNNEKLNDSQKEAVRRIVQGQCRPSPYIIFGPPGTGKTVTLIEAVLQTYMTFKNSRIVICAPSNSAADLVVQRLLGSNIVGEGEVVRLNSYQRNVENIPDFIKPLCQDKSRIEDVIKYPIIVCTCSTAGAMLMLEYKFGHFTHVFIDEAGQATEPESVLVVSLLSQNHGQVILSGDPYQLGPVLRSKFAVKHGLQTSYLERLIQSDQYKRNTVRFGKFGGYDPLLVTMLIESYRSHPSILEFPSKTFYFSELICSVPKERIGSLDNWKMLPKKGFPLIFHGAEGEELREENSPSWFNPVEVMQVVLYLQNLYEDGLTPEDIGIIAPYRKQVEKIRLLISAFRLESPKIGSVEEFQGQERKVIIITTVRSNNDLIDFDKIHNLGFLSNPKRTNVAITRAKDLLIVIGNPYILQNDYYWKQFMIYVVSHDGYLGCDLPSPLKQ